MGNCSSSGGSKGSGAAKKASGGGEVKPTPISAMSVKDAMEKLDISRAYETNVKAINDINGVQPSFDQFTQSLSKSSAQNKDAFLQQAQGIVDKLKSSLPMFEGVKQAVEQNAVKWQAQQQKVDNELKALEIAYRKKEAKLSKADAKLVNAWDDVVNKNSLRYFDKERGREIVSPTVYYARNDPAVREALAKANPQYASQILSIGKKLDASGKAYKDFNHKSAEEDRAIRAKAPKIDDVMNAPFRNYSIVQELKPMVQKLNGINPRLFKQFIQALPPISGSTLNSMTS